MNNSLEYLALRKQLLQARSTLYRLRIRHEVDAARNSLGWAQAGVMAAKALTLRATVLGLALHGVPHGRLARWLALAARVVLLAKAAGSAVRLLQKPPPPATR
jgi:hypothetical protein